MKKLNRPLIFLLLLGILLQITIHKNMAHAQEPVDGIPEGYKIIEGDIIVPENFGDPDGIGVQSTFGDTAFWANGIVPFVFDANVTSINQTRMLAAMSFWEDVANVDFRPRSSETDFVHIRNSTVNRSSVGRQGGRQFIDITSWNSTWIMAHELAHALGVWHEQSRPDRDNYIQINLDNIQSGSEHNFEIRDAADVYPLEVYGLAADQTYDFDSVMHYGQCFFSIDCPSGSDCNCTNTTISVRSPNQAWQTQIGQRTHLSHLDQLTMSFLYSENNWRFVDSTYSGAQNGNFIEPYRDYKQGINSTPSNGTLWIQPGRYSGTGVYNKPMILRAPLGGVTLGP